MITGEKRLFLARCMERGYTLDEVRPCIVSEDGDRITVDETHSSYPRAPKHAVRATSMAARAGGSAVTPARPPSGPGTELKKLLKLVGITATPNCPCNARAAQMDAWGPDECEKRLDEIVDWLGEEAGRRRIPFVRMAATQVVRLAIRRARNAARSGHKPSEGTS